MPLSQLSNEDLLALKSGDLSKVSNEGLMAYKQMKAGQAQASQQAQPQPFQDTQNQDKASAAQTGQTPVEKSLARRAMDSVGAFTSGATDATVGRLGFNNKSDSEAHLPTEHPTAYGAGYAAPPLVVGAVVGEGALNAAGGALKGLGGLISAGMPSKAKIAMKGLSKLLGSSAPEAGASSEAAASALPSGARNAWMAPSQEAVGLEAIPATPVRPIPAPAPSTLEQVLSAGRGNVGDPGKLTIDQLMAPEAQSALPGLKEMLLKAAGK